MPHSIRLREPWQVTPTGGTDAIRHFTRRFNLPTGLAAGQAVGLHVSLEPGAVLQGGYLNEHELAWEPTGDGQHEAEIQAWMQAFNTLTLVIACPSPTHQTFAQCAAAELRLES